MGLDFEIVSKRSEERLSKMWYAEREWKSVLTALDMFLIMLMISLNDT